jgi:hypothetical protein
MEGRRRKKFEFETGDLVLTLVDESQGFKEGNKMVAIVEWYFRDVIKPVDSFYQLIAGDQIIQRGRKYVWEIPD